MATQPSNIDWFRDLVRLSAKIEDKNPYPVLDWLNQLRTSIVFQSSLIGLGDLRGWVTEPETGNVIHEQQSFFAVEGVRISAVGLREIDGWDQPIITQKEGGILALLARQERGIIEFLVQAKAEPGNIGCLQLSPTLQATQSNLARAHEGKRPPFSELVFGEISCKLVFSASQNEDGGRFWQKQNETRIYLLDDPQVRMDSDLTMFRWVSLSQIKAIALIPNVLSPHVKAIIAPL